VVLGLAAAAGASRLLASQLFGVSPTDPAVLLLVSAALVAVAALASVIPARRAAAIDPVVTLRSE
jgi:ABC-type lipoprotein release transport system permease subunit